MKYLITIALIFVSITVMAQRKMGGSNLWLNSQYYADTSFVDTSVFDLSNGFILKLDSVGSSSTGYYGLTTDSFPAFPAHVKGSGTATQVTYWETSDSLGNSPRLTFDNGTNELSINQININGKVNDTNYVEINSDTLKWRPDYFRVTTSGKPVEFYPRNTFAMKIDSAIIAIGGETDSTDFKISNESPDQSALYVKSRDLFGVGGQLGGIGINTTGAPSTYLHIVGDVGNTPIRIDNPNTLAPGASTATLSNFPTGGDADVFLLINLDGTDYIFPGWTAP